MNEINRVKSKISNKTLFDKIDANSDGTLSTQELRNTGWFTNLTLTAFKELLPIESICKNSWTDLELFSNHTSKKVAKPFEG